MTRRRCKILPSLLAGHTGASGTSDMCFDVVQQLLHKVQLGCGKSALYMGAYRMCGISRLIKKDDQNEYTVVLLSPLYCLHIYSYVTIMYCAY